MTRREKSSMLTHAQIQQFKIDGYLVLPKVFDASTIAELNDVTLNHLQNRVLPFEMETDVQYPGAPTNESAQGGQTIRRLRMAYQRAEVYANAANKSSITEAISQILSGQSLFLNPNHHNCVMTKLPQYSSETHWHRDTRYWNFDNKYLINAWIALGDEKEANGCMKVLPGSHRWDVRKEALDSAQFLIPDHPDNKWRLDTERLVELTAGDVLLFSAHCFHAAGKNKTNSPKFSSVFTYHTEETSAIEGTHSASAKPIKLGAG